MSLDKKLENPPKSMLTLYGEDESRKVIKRCYEVNPFFGEWVCEKIYGELWELEPLSMVEKSLITVVALMVTEKEEQLMIHLKGLWNLGKSVNFFETLVDFLISERFISSDEKILKFISKTFEISKSDNEHNAEKTLSYRDKIIIRVTAFATLGNNTDTENFLKEVCLNKALLTEEIFAIFLHLMIYCGCPVTMNACSILNNVLAEYSI